MEDEEKRWYCVGESGSATGPLTATALREQCTRQGRDANEVLVWREGLINWVALASVKELQQECRGAAHAETFSVRTMTFDPGVDSTTNGAPEIATLASVSTSGRTLEQRKRGRDEQQPGRGGGRAKSRAGAATQQREHTTTSVYVTGLPDDTDEMEVRDVFSKCGIIKSAGEADAGGNGDGYKIKLYRDMASGVLKGDALVTYLKVRHEHASQNTLFCDFCVRRQFELSTLTDPHCAFRSRCSASGIL